MDVSGIITQRPAGSLVAFGGITHSIGTAWSDHTFGRAETATMVQEPRSNGPHFNLDGEAIFVYIS